MHASTVKVVSEPAVHKSAEVTKQAWKGIIPLLEKLEGAYGCELILHFITHTADFTFMTRISGMSVLNTRQEARGPYKPC